MKRITSLTIVLSSIAATGFSAAEDPVREAVQKKGERTLLEDTVALEHARLEADAASDFSMELRPSLSDDDAGVALRIYLPDSLSRKNLKTQLALASTAEQLRIAQLEWEEIASAYRELCTYRMLDKKIALLDQEIRFIEPYLEKADEGVERNQLELRDRTRLYSDYLNLLNEQNEFKSEQAKTTKELKLILGPDAELETLAEQSVIPMPEETDLQELMRTAKKQRADYKQLGIEAESMRVAEETARGENRFRFKYIQPSYNVDYDNGKGNWELSTALILPWGASNADAAFYRQHQAFIYAEQSLQEQVIEDRLRVIIASAKAYGEQAAENEQRIAPVLKQLNADLDQQINRLLLDQVRDLISVRRQLLDAALQTVDAECNIEKLAVDLAEELGAW